MCLKKVHICACPPSVIFVGGGTQQLGIRSECTHLLLHAAKFFVAKKVKLMEELKDVILDRKISNDESIERHI